MITVALDDKGEISNVINDKGGPTSIKPRDDAESDRVSIILCRANGPRSLHHGRMEE